MIDNKVIALINDYSKRIKVEKLSSEGACAVSYKLDDKRFAIALNVDGNKDLTIEDIKEASLFDVNTNSEIELHRQTYVKHKETKSVIHAYPIYCVAIGNAKIKIPALLDDMAQIVGPSALWSENEISKIQKVLKKRNACIIVGNGVITHGRSMDEAYVACLVLEKSAKTFIDVNVIGNYKVINAFETRLMHFIYKKKYSKKNQENLSSDDKVEEKPAKKLNISEEEMKKRIAVVEAGKKLVQSNLVQGTWGNISIRLDDTRMLISPSGLDYLSLTPEDMVIVDMDTLEYEGLHKPSSEKGIHAMMLKSRDDINVVMHSHPTECSSFAAAHVSMPIVSEEMKKYVKGDAKCAGYGLPGTGKLAKSTVSAMEGRNACFMANHGMLAVGATIEDTFETCRVMEESAKAHIEKLAGCTDSSKSAETRIEFFKKVVNK